jgi:hypothetical protein
MNDDAFARLVAEEVKNNISDAQKQYLLLPENWGRWRRALEALTDNLKGQLDRIERETRDQIARYERLGDDGFKLVAEVAAEAEHKTKKINRFKFHVESRLEEVGRMIALGSDSIDEKVQVVEFLRTAISTHRKMMEDNDLEPTEIDLALWQALDGVWSFDKVNTASL